ncbi:hypothetical protein K438DRAFT_1813612 [Mycena galopus ATCC 62051]|nr:hypothetical protein K438DRAFT_1813612 [Mycena galopus ATCC 62051]
MTWLFWRKRHRRNNDASSCTLPQELVDECMSYLNDDYSNLRAAALVCRSWSLAAQGFLFKTLRLNTTGQYHRVNRRCACRRTSFATFRHLFCTEAFCTRSRSRLKLSKNSAIFHSRMWRAWFLLVFVDIKTDMTLRTAIALQRLFSLPSLRRMKLDNAFTDSVAFLAMWGSCPPAIRHLQLGCRVTSDNTLHPILPRSSLPVALTSLSSAF